MSTIIKRLSTTVRVGVGGVFVPELTLGLVATDLVAPLARRELVDGSW